MALMQITVIPLGTGSPSVGDYIADVQRFLLQRNVQHTLGDMGTVVQGSTDELFTLAGEIHNLCFSEGVQRIVTHITIDDRRDIDRKIGEKRQSVVNRLQGKSDL